MRQAGLVVPLMMVLLSSPAPARADVVCVPGDFSPSGASSCPGSVQHYQGSSPGMQEQVGARTAVPSGGQALPGNPNCYVAPHAVVGNGAPCKRDRDCPDRRCRLFPDGDKYCVAEQKTCTLPGNDGTVAGAVIGLHQQCYECSAGMGWKLCGETAKQALLGNQKGVVVHQGSDERSRDDWRSREPTTGHQVDTDTARTTSRSR